MSQELRKETGFIGKIIDWERGMYVETKVMGSF